MKARPKYRSARVFSKKQDGSDRAPVKAGRLTIEDILWLYDIMDELKDDLTDMQAPE